MSLPDLNRRGSLPKTSKRRERSKTCPGCGATFRTRTKLAAHLRESLEQAERTAREQGFTEAADKISATLNQHRKEPEMARKKSSSDKQQGGNPNVPMKGPGDRIRSGESHPKPQKAPGKQSGVAQPRKR